MEKKPELLGVAPSFHLLLMGCFVLSCVFMCVHVTLYTELYPTSDGQQRFSSLTIKKMQQSAKFFTH